MLFEVEHEEKMKIQVTKDFEVWASGYSGCDGGNLSGRLWFCGIEYGRRENENTFEFDDVTNPAYISDDDRKEMLRYQYNMKVAKLYSAIKGQNAKDYAKIAIEDRIFDKESNLFKMNLYPIAFPRDKDDRGDEWLYRKTGLATKSMYRAWCQIHRFAQIREWTKNYSPKLIVATGITHQKEFIMAFDSIDTIYKKDQINRIRDNRLVWLKINSERSILAVIPFPGGSNGLNSDALLKEFGSEIRSICEREHGQNWLSD